MTDTHDIRVGVITREYAATDIYVRCHTHNVVLLEEVDVPDVPLVDIMAAVAEHREHKTVGAAMLSRNEDGTYRLDMDGVNLSMAVIGGSDFEVHQYTDGEKFIRMSVGVDDVSFGREDVKMIGGSTDGEKSHHAFTLYNPDENQ